MQARAFPFHHETRATLRTTVHAAFEHLDDFKKLSAHMEEPSAMMLGSQMQIVTERNPPHRKAWETVDARLLVIGQYRLGFELQPGAEGCELRVFIDYDWPNGAMARTAAALFGKSYARWCTERMAGDAAEYFNVHRSNPQT